MIGIAEARQRWQLTDMEQIADTHGSLVYRGRHADHAAVVVKLLKPSGMGELSGMDYLAWRDGAGAIALLDRRDNACLLEDAGHRTLEDLRQTEGEAVAVDIFAGVLSQLHARSPRPFPSALVPLERHFEALIDGQVAIPSAHADHVGWAADQARDLLSTQADIMPLHGDLHHENLIADAQGRWRAIDPHGLIGDPHYDLANFFGNPLGRPDITVDPGRIALVADRLSRALSYDRTRVLRFAAVHAALSACWSIGDPVSDGDRSDAHDRLRFLAVVRGMLARSGS